MDTLKSIAVIALLGAVLYGVYVVASKPDRPAPPEIAMLGPAAISPPVIDTGSPTNQREAPSAMPQLLAPPRLAPRNPLAAEQSKMPEISPPPASSARIDSQVQPATTQQGVSETSREMSTPADKPSIYLAPSSSPPAKSMTSTEKSPASTPAASGGSFASDWKADGEASPSNADAASKPNNATPSGSVAGASYTRPQPVTAEDIQASQNRVRQYAFQQAWKAAQDQVNERRPREALLTLSAFYDDPAVPEKDRQALLEWLDALAARVIYSTDHLLESAYEVRRGENLYAIAERYHVPYLLLRNINGVRDPDLLLPGTKLKVVPGPFRAELSLRRKELTLFVGGLYAGRFPCTFGDQPIPPGEHAVREKSLRKSFHSSIGTLGPNDPRNPYGGIWMDLGGEVSIHGSPAEAYVGQLPSSISLTPRDAEDVYSILSVGSQVVVKE